MHQRETQDVKPSGSFQWSSASRVSKWKRNWNVTRANWTVRSGDIPWQSYCFLQVNLSQWLILINICVMLQVPSLKWFKWFLWLVAVCCAHPGLIQNLINLSGRKRMATHKDGHRDRIPLEESYGLENVPCPGDTLPWNLSKHQRIKRSKSASVEVLDPAERAVIRIAGRTHSCVDSL